ncbi:DUF4232 domain-containing protein [uncultured Frigoribacterium sp.]|uniref:DUF4232 domain-containing protein n=1 Tax=uncultured Frigoribacterium sp. TaxID=335377 RepID=UPI0028D2A18C|nr:DUF4232 domain-containing protein [uncultured Frigoribacterium sp.]
MNRSVKIILPLVLASSLGLLVAGCTSGDPDVSSTGASSSASPSAPDPVASDSPAATDPAEPSATPGPDGASGGGGDLGDGASSDASARCTVDELGIEIADGGGQGGGGAAGSYGVAFIFTNTGDRTCTLQGWPGVSFVGGGNGTQVGASATLDRGTPHDTQDLAPGGETQALVKITQAGNYDPAECQPTATDGFRIYPPGSVRSIFVGASGSSYEACANAAVQQLSPSALAAFSPAGRSRRSVAGVRAGRTPATRHPDGQRPCPPGPGGRATGR